MSTQRALIVDLVNGGTADLDEVMATMHAAFDPRFGEAWTRSQCSGILGLAGVWLILARQNGCSAGFALSRAIADEAELLLLAVKPEQRRYGVGRAMLAAICSEAAARGAGRLHLEMRDGNPAVGLYQGEGFSEVGRRRHYYRGKDGSSFDAITLACPLAIPK